jgi:hypothetical protein
MMSSNQAIGKDEKWLGSLNAPVAVEVHRETHTSNLALCSVKDSKQNVMEGETAPHWSATAMFDSKVLPDVNHATRILAVCGVGGVESADPVLDGWMVSDFYLSTTYSKAKPHLRNGSPAWIRKTW